MDLKGVLSMRGLLAGMAAVLGLLAGGGATAAPMAFDLRCGEARYRIDLQSMAWCEGDCRQVRPIRRQDRGSITLDAFEHFALTYEPRRRVMTSTFEGLGVESREETRCRVKAFSGLPPRKVSASSGE